MQTNGDYWFPAKRYGWGWGFPITWQGWLVLLGFFALVLFGIYLFPREPAAVEQRPKQSGGHGVAVGSWRDLLFEGGPVQRRS